MADSTLNLNATLLRDYDSDGTEKSFPDLRRQCPVGETCSKCIRYDVTALMLHVPGDFYVIGEVIIYFPN